MIQMPLMLYCLLANSSAAHAWRIWFVLHASTAGEYLERLHAYSLWCSVRAFSYPDSGSEVDAEAEIPYLTVRNNPPMLESTRAFASKLMCKPDPDPYTGPAKAALTKSKNLPELITELQKQPSKVFLSSSASSEGVDWVSPQLGQLLIAGQSKGTDCSRFCRAYDVYARQQTVPSKYPQGRKVELSFEDQGRDNFNTCRTVG